MVNLSDCLAWHVLLHVKFWIHANCFILGELYDLYWGNYILDLKIILGLPWYAKIKYVYMTINWRFSTREQVKILMTKEKLLKFSVRNKNKLNIPNPILNISKTTWPRRNLQISSFFYCLYNSARLHVDSPNLILESANLCKFTELQSKSFASRDHQTGRTDSVFSGPLILVFVSDIRPQQARNFSTTLGWNKAWKNKTK